jgi:hypothetical protein
MELDGVTLTEAVPVTLTEGEGVLEGLCVAVAVVDAGGLVVGVGDPVAVAVVLGGPLVDGEGDPVTEELGDSDVLGDPLPLGDGVTLLVPDPDEVSDGEDVGVRDPVALLEDDRETEAEGDGSGDVVKDDDPLLLPEGLLLGVTLRVALGDVDGDVDGVTEVDAVREADSEVVEERLLETDHERVGEGLWVTGLGVGEGVGVGVGVGVDVGDDDRLRSAAWVPLTRQSASSKARARRPGGERPMVGPAGGRGRVMHSESVGFA